MLVGFFAYPIPEIGISVRAQAGKTIRNAAHRRLSQAIIEEAIERCQ